MQTTASAASRRCVARSSSPSSSALRRSAGAPRVRSASLTVRAFGPGSEIQEGVEVGARVKVTKPIKVKRRREKNRERESRDSEEEAIRTKRKETAIFSFSFLNLFVLFSNLLQPQKTKNHPPTPQKKK